MNERIKELAEQAGFKYIKEEGIGWAGDYRSSLPKFAELIIRECMKVAVFRDDEYVNTATTAGYMAAGRETAARMIKGHFGVEE
jgi:hypothetical protein